MHSPRSMHHLSVASLVGLLRASAAPPSPSPATAAAAASSVPASAAVAVAWMDERARSLSQRAARCQEKLSLLRASGAEDDAPEVLPLREEIREVEQDMRALESERRALVRRAQVHERRERERIEKDAAARQRQQRLAEARQMMEHQQQQSEPSAGGRHRKHTSIASFDPTKLSPQHAPLPRGVQPPPITQAQLRPMGPVSELDQELQRERRAEAARQRAAFERMCGGLSASGEVASARMPGTGSGRTAASSYQQQHHQQQQYRARKSSNASTRSVSPRQAPGHGGIAEEGDSDGESELASHFHSASEGDSGSDGEGGTPRAHLQRQATVSQSRPAHRRQHTLTLSRALSVAKVEPLEESKESSTASESDVCLPALRLAGSAGGVAASAKERAHLAFTPQLRPPFLSTAATAAATDLSASLQAYFAASGAPEGTTATEALTDPRLREKISQALLRYISAATSRAATGNDAPAGAQPLISRDEKLLWGLLVGTLRGGEEEQLAIEFWQEREKQLYAAQAARARRVHQLAAQAAAQPPSLRSATNQQAQQAQQPVTAKEHLAQSPPSVPAAAAPAPDSRQQAQQVQPPPVHRQVLVRKQTIPAPVSAGGDKQSTTTSSSVPHVSRGALLLRLSVVQEQQRQLKTAKFINEMQLKQMLAAQHQQAQALAQAQAQVQQQAQVQAQRGPPPLLLLPPHTPHDARGYILPSHGLMQQHGVPPPFSPSPLLALPSPPSAGLVALSGAPPPALSPQALSSLSAQAASSFLSHVSATSSIEPMCRRFVYSLLSSALANHATLAKQDRVLSDLRWALSKARRIRALTANGSINRPPGARPAWQSAVSVPTAMPTQMQAGRGLLEFLKQDESQSDQPSSRTEHHTRRRSSRQGIDDESDHDSASGDRHGSPTRRQLKILLPSGGSAAAAEGAVVPVGGSSPVRTQFGPGAILPPEDEAQQRALQHWQLVQAQARAAAAEEARRRAEEEAANDPFHALPPQRMDGQQGAEGGTGAGSVAQAVPAPPALSAEAEAELEAQRVARWDPSTHEWRDFVRQLDSNAAAAPTHGNNSRPTSAVPHPHASAPAVPAAPAPPVVKDPTGRSVAPPPTASERYAAASQILLSSEARLEDIPPSLLPRREYAGLTLSVPHPDRQADANAAIRRQEAALLRRARAAGVGEDAVLAQRRTFLSHFSAPTNSFDWVAPDPDNPARKCGADCVHEGSYSGQRGANDQDGSGTGHSQACDERLRAHMRQSLTAGRPASASAVHRPPTHAVPPQSVRPASARLRSLLLASSPGVSPPLAGTLPLRSRRRQHEAFSVSVTNATRASQQLEGSNSAAARASQAAAVAAARRAHKNGAAGGFATSLRPTSAGADAAIVDADGEAIDASDPNASPLAAASPDAPVGLQLPPGFDPERYARALPLLSLGSSTSERGVDATGAPSLVPVPPSSARGGGGLQLHLLARDVSEADFASAHTAAEEKRARALLALQARPPHASVQRNLHHPQKPARSHAHGREANMW